MPLVSTFGSLSARAFGLGAYRASGAFTPASLFASGEQGVWYDPSDLTTMFEDSAGTTAVHTPGNGTADSPVGLLMDKHANYPATSGSARYNLLTYSQDFTNSAWAKLGSPTITSNSTTAPDGTTTASTLSLPTGSNSIFQGVSSSSNTLYTTSVSMKQGTFRYGYAVLCLSGSDRYSVLIDLQTGLFVESKTIGTISNASYLITSQGNGWYRLSITAQSTGSNGYLIVSNTDTIPITVNNANLEITNRSSTGSIYIWGTDYRLNSLASTNPTYQYVTSSWAAAAPGNHATQSTSTSRPTLSARYNLLTYSEQFDNGAWTKYNSATVTANSTTAPDGATTADTLTLPSGGPAAIYQNPTNSQNGTIYTASVSFKQNTHRYGYLSFAPTIGNRYAVLIDLQTGLFVESKTQGTLSNTSYSITDQGNGWYRLSISASVSSGNAMYMVIECTDTTPITVDGTIDITNRSASGSVYIWGADLRVTNDGVGLPAYQRVADANTYDSTGFPYYLKSDGVDDGQTTSTIDFTGTNKITVFAGIRKLSDSALASVAELSATIASNNGSFLLSAPNSAAGNYNFSSKGTTQVDNTVTTYTAPITSIVTGIGDISAPNNQIRVNGSVAGTQTGSQGTGNYGNYALYLFRRGGASAPFNGRTYGLIIRGASSTSTEIANTEAWLNDKTKAY